LKGINTFLLEGLCPIILDAHRIIGIEIVKSQYSIATLFKELRTMKAWRVEK